MKKMKVLALVAVCLITIGIVATETYAADIGVVFMHGKNGSPNSPALKGIVEEMSSSGMEVMVPDMPWSRSRGYDASYDDAMREIHKLVEALRAKGVKTVFIAGHSLGANGAIGYGAIFGDVDGIIAIAPGHAPEIPAFQSIVGESVKKANDMVAAGHGKDKAEFTDTNQGKVSSVSTTAAIYLGYFSPDGAAVIPSNISKWKKSIPLLWVVGRSDPMYARGEVYAYKKFPANTENQYIVVDADHMGTPDAAKDQVVAWMQKVAGARIKKK
jgi:pimeloyl-ACP methyl ester carboxylesterase